MNYELLNLKLMKKITYIVFFFCCVAMGQQIPDVYAEIDTTHIKIGEQVTYSITASKDGNVTFPKLKLKGLEVAEELPTDTLKNSLSKKYLITGFDSGAFYVQKQQVFIDAKEYFTDSLLVHVASMKVDTVQIAKSLESKEVIGEKFTFWERIYPYLKYVIAVLVLVGLHFLAYLFYKDPSKKRKAKKIVQVPPYITATKELEALTSKELWQNNKVKEYYSELTDIVRKYIGNELNIQALENTTDELLAVLTAENKEQKLNLDKEVLNKLEGLLSQADFVKFAKQKPIENEIRGHRSDAELIINTIHDIVESKKKEAENDEEQ